MPRASISALCASSVLTGRPFDRRKSIRKRRISLRPAGRSEEHTSELQSLMRISYAVFCLKKKTIVKPHIQRQEAKMISINVHEYHLATKIPITYSVHN